MKKITFIFCLLVFSLPCYAQKESVHVFEKTTSITDRNSLSQHFTNFSILEINNQTDINKKSSLLIKLLNNKTISIDISDSEISTNKFPVFVDGVSRKSIEDKNTVKTFQKITSNKFVQTVYNGSKLYSLNYKNENGIFYIERLQKFVPNSNKNLYVFYSTNDIKEINDACSVSSAFTYSKQLKLRLSNYVQKQSMANECINLKLAIGCPSNMQTHYGSVSNVESEITTIINDISSNFDINFNKRVDFEIASINVATSTSSSLDTALGSLTNYIDILNAFRDWSNDGNLTSLEYDLGLLFTRTDFDGTPVGGAFTNALCSNPQNKYIVVQDYYSGGLMKNLVSHEIGHSFGCIHTGSGIMTASVSSSTTWDTNSIIIINEKENSSNCNFGSDALDGTPNALFVLAEKACKNELIVINATNSRNSTSWNWTFSDGAPQSGQEITTSFSTSGFKDVSLSVQNNYTQCNNTSNINTKSIEIIDLDSPQNASCTTVYDSNNGTQGNWGNGITNVTFGSINHDSEDGFVDKKVYDNNTCSETTVESLNSIVPISITIASQPNFDVSTKAWIDYNNDGLFTTDELVLENFSDTQVVTGNINLNNSNIPLGTLLRLRIITDFNPIANACIKPSFGQVDDYGVIIEDNLSIDAFSIENDIKLIGNPFNNNADISIPENNSFNYLTINVYDTLGKWYSTNTFLPHTNNYTIPTNSLSSGIYYFAIIADGKTLKVIKGIKMN